jgi:acyl dehydratase
MNDRKENYMDDLKVGQKFTSGPLDVTADDIMAYAKKYDPQDFHTDPARAKNTVFGELIASGWHTASLTMRLIIEASPPMKGGMIGRSVERMSWLKPVKPGDKLFFEGEILDLRASNSNPERGIMRVKNTTFNQNHEPVLEMETVVFVPRRPKSA